MGLLDSLVPLPARDPSLPRWDAQTSPGIGQGPQMGPEALMQQLAGSMGTPTMGGPDPGLVSALQAASAPGKQPSKWMEALPAIAQALAYFAQDRRAHKDRRHHDRQAQDLQSRGFDVAPYNPTPDIMGQGFSHLIGQVANQKQFKQAQQAADRQARIEAITGAMEEGAKARSKKYEQDSSTRRTVLGSILPALLRESPGADAQALDALIQQIGGTKENRLEAQKANPKKGPDDKPSKLDEMDALYDRLLERGVDPETSRNTAYGIKREKEPGSDDKLSQAQEEIRKRALQDDVVRMWSNKFHPMGVQRLIGGMAYLRTATMDYKEMVDYLLDINSKGEMMDRRIKQAEASEDADAQLRDLYRKDPQIFQLVYGDAYE